MKVTGIINATTTITKVLTGRRIVGARVLLPVKSVAELPPALSYTLYQYTPAATWTFTNPTNHTPSVSVYMLSGVEADTDVDINGNQIVVTWSSPHSGYLVVT